MERISYNDLKATISADNAVSVFNWNGLNIEVKRFLSMEDMILFTDAVCDSCFDYSTGKYRPEVKDFVTRSCILEIYANFDLPENLEERYELVYQSDVIPEIMKYISKAQFDAILIAIDNKIDERIDINIARFEKEKEEVLAQASDLLSIIQSIFDGIDNSTVKRIADSVSNTNIDTDHFIKATVEANVEARKKEEAAKEAQASK